MNLADEKMKSKYKSVHNLLHRITMAESLMNQALRLPLLGVLGSYAMGRLPWLPFTASVRLTLPFAASASVPRSHIADANCGLLETWLLC